jgi:SAM-dependent methyltransferase
MKNQIIQYLKKQSFQPGLAGVLLNPFFFIRRALFLHIKALAVKQSGKLLDFGCGRKPYRNLFPNVAEYIGVDIEQQTGHDHTNSQVDVFYDGKTIPFEKNVFDSIFCSEVLEHVFNIDDIIPELNRVLKKDGQLLLTVPFCWNEHEVPYDFGRYTSFGIKHLLEKHGFSVIENRKSGRFSQVICQLNSLYVYEVLKKWVKPKVLHYLLSMLLIVPVNILGSIICFVLPRNQSLYFNNVVLAKKN